MAGEKIFVGVAWPYVNGDLHPGHFAGNLLPADIFARYQRLHGKDVLMVSGSDVHGTPITIEADKKGKTPQEIVDINHAKDLELFSAYHLSYNLYTKTDTEIHKKVVQEMFLTLLKNDEIIRQKSMQYYSEEDKKFLPDRYVEGTCPHCGAKDQRSDQCENCGRSLEAGEILNPVSKLTGNPVTMKETEHYYLDLAKFSDRLKKWMKKNKHWRGWVYEQTMHWLDEGIHARSITRDLDWGVEIPADRIPDEKKINDIDSKRIYVWFEAVIGYLSASQEWSHRINTHQTQGKDILFGQFDGQSSSWEDWWKNPEVKHFYFMGKDNLVFHTINWPAQLMGYDKSLTLPYFPAINQFLNLQGKKFSKSRGWSIESKRIAKEYGADSVRYYIASTFPENRDGNFTWEDFVAVNNNELVANLGNFIHRTLTFVKSNFDGKLEKKQLGQQILFEIRDAFKDTSLFFEKVELADSLRRIMKLAQFGNKYFNDSQVWKVVKEDKEQAAIMLYNSVQIINALRILLSPFLPLSMDTLSRILSVEKVTPRVETDYWGFEELTTIKLADSVEPLFGKIDEEVIEKEKNLLGLS